MRKTLPGFFPNWNAKGGKVHRWAVSRLRDYLRKNQRIFHRVRKIAILVQRDSSRYVVGNERQARQWECISSRDCILSRVASTCRKRHLIFIRISFLRSINSFAHKPITFAVKSRRDWERERERDRIYKDSNYLCNIIFILNIKLDISRDWFNIIDSVITIDIPRVTSP